MFRDAPQLFLDGIKEDFFAIGTYIGLFSMSTIHQQCDQRYTYRVLQTIQMILILLCVWAERAVLGSAKTALTGHPGARNL